MTLTPSEIIWTAINFVVLMLVLNRLLFKPYLEFMDRRTAENRAATASVEKADERILAHAEELKKINTVKTAESLLETEELKKCLESQRQQKLAVYKDEIQQKRLAAEKLMTAAERDEQKRIDDATAGLAEELVAALLSGQRLPDGKFRAVQTAGTTFEGGNKRA